MWKQKIKDVASSHVVQLLAVGVSATAVGALASYKVTAQRLELKYKQISDEEIASVKEHYSILRKDGVNGDLATLAAPYHDNERILRDEGYVPANDEPATADDIAAALERVESTPEADDLAREEAQSRDEQRREDDEPVVGRVNIFQSDDPDSYFDWDEELQRRETFPDKPYVITKDEFEAGDKDYTTTTLTYFDDDGVLVDDKSQIADIETVVGEENVLRFGHASEDSNIVYVRNEDLELDIEVIKANGSYAKQVLGFIEHSDDYGRRARRFRHDD